MIHLPSRERMVFVDGAAIVNCANDFKLCFGLCVKGMWDLLVGRL